jgi:hypothetical protein
MMAASTNFNPLIKFSAENTPPRDINPPSMDDNLKKNTRKINICGNLR